MRNFILSIIGVPFFAIIFGWIINLFLDLGELSYFFGLLASFYFNGSLLKSRGPIGDMTFEEHQQLTPTSWNDYKVKESYWLDEKNRKKKNKKQNLFTRFSIKSTKSPLQEKPELFSEIWSIQDLLYEQYENYSEDEIVDEIISNIDKGIISDFDKGKYYYFDDSKYHKISYYFARETPERRDGKQTTYIGYEFELFCEEFSDEYLYCKKEHIEEDINIEKIEKKLLCENCFKFLFLEEE